jgi:hypothetical protein
VVLRFKAVVPTGLVASEIETGGEWIRA